MELLNSLLFGLSAWFLWFLQNDSSEMNEIPCSFRKQGICGPEQGNYSVLSINSLLLAALETNRFTQEDNIIKTKFRRSDFIRRRPVGIPKPQAAFQS
jgi:hypothetical protein